MSDPNACHGCKHLSYSMPDDAVSAAHGGMYHCAKFGAAMPASETPRPLESATHRVEERAEDITITCKEPQ